MEKVVRRTEAQRQAWAEIRKRMQARGTEASAAKHWASRVTLPKVKWLEKVA